MSTQADSAHKIHRGMAVGSVLRILNLCAGAAVALLLMPFMVHHLGDRAYGAWSLVVAYISYYNLLDLGLTTAISQYLCIALGRHDESEAATVFNTSLVLQTIIGVFALLITVALAPFAAHLLRAQMDSATVWQVTLILGFNTALGFPARVYAGVLDAEYRFVAQSGLNLAGVVLRSLLMVFAVLYGQSIVFLAWSTLLATLPVLGAQILIARRCALWTRIQLATSSLAHVRQMFFYSAFAFITTIADNLRYQIDPLIITAAIGLSAVTHYRVASALMSYSINVVIMTTGIVQPMLSRAYGKGDHAQLERAFLFVSKISVLFALLVCTLTILFGQSFVLRWMGRSYADAYLPMVLLALAVFLDVSQNPSIGLLYATFNHRYYALINVIEGVINLVASLLLVQRYGIAGVAMGTLIGAILIRIFVQPIVVCRVTKIDSGSYLSQTLRTLVVGLVAVCAAALAGHWAVREAYSFLISGVLCSVAVFFLCSYCMAFSDAERASLRAVLLRRKDAA